MKSVKALLVGSYDVSYLLETMCKWAYHACAEE